MTRSKKGTSIIEIVIAASLISMAVIAALSLTNRSQKQSTYARNLAEATKYASEASDWIRNERTNLGWATMSTMSDGVYCLNTLPADFTLISSGSCLSGNYITGSTIYQRTLNMTKSATSIKFNIEVSWQENVPRQATIEMELSEW